MVPTRSPAASWCDPAGERPALGKPETFNFLGFTFICGKTCQGKFQIKRKTRRDRMRAKLKMIKEEMWKCMHQPIPGEWLWKRGHDRLWWQERGRADAHCQVPMTEVKRTQRCGSVCN